MTAYKRVATIFSTVSCILFAGFGFNVIPAHAQTASSDSFGRFEVGLPGGSDFRKGGSIDTFIQSFQDRPILALVGMFVQFVIALIVIIGVITIVIGGYLYMTAGGNAHQVEQAKEMVYSSLVGIFIAFISVVILNTINPFLGSKAVEPTLATPFASSNAAIINEPGKTNTTGN